MTEAVGNLRVNLTADWADFRTQLDRASQQLNNFGQGFGNVAGAITRAGLGLFAGFKVGEFINDSINATIQFHELEGAFRAAFGDQAEPARRWATNLAEALRKPEDEIIRLADRFQDIFQQISPTSEAAAEASERFTQLAEDFAELKSIPVDQAFELIQRGLAGSARALRQYGIDLSESNVRQVALREGIIHGNEQLSSQQGYLVRAAILQRALAAATGEAARQSGEADRAQDAMRASLERSQHALGDALIPAVTALSNALAGALDAFNNFFEGVGRSLANNEAFVNFFAQLGNFISGGRHSYEEVAAAVHSTIEEQRRGLTVQHQQATATHEQTQSANDYATALLNQARNMDHAIGTEHARGKTLEETLTLLRREQQSLSLNNVQRDVEAETLRRVNELRDSYNKNLDGEPARQIRAAVAINANIERFNQLIDQLDPVSAATREYRLDQTALDTALQHGRITQEAYNRSVETLNFRYRNVLDTQQTFLNAQERERQLSGLTNEQRRVEEQVIQELDRRQIDYASNKDGPVANAIRQEIELTERLSRVHTVAQGVYDRFVAPTERYREALEGITEAANQYGLTSGQRLQLELEAELESLRNNTDAASGLRRAMIQLQLDSIDAATRTEHAFTQSFNGLKDTLADVAAGTRDAGEAFRQYLLEVLKSQFIKPFLDSIFNDLLASLRGQTIGGSSGGLFNGLFAGVGNFIGSLFGGFRADGGPVVPGMVYEVGERGRELFVPSTPGHIVSHEKAGQRSVTLNVYTPDANSFRASRRQLARHERRMLGVE